MKGEGGGGGEGEGGGGLALCGNRVSGVRNKICGSSKKYPPRGGHNSIPLLFTPYPLLFTPYSLLFTPYSLPQNSHRPHLFLAAVIAFAEPDFVGVNALVHEFAAVSAVPFKINAGAVEE